MKYFITPENAEFYNKMCALGLKLSFPLSYYSKEAVSLENWIYDGFHMLALI